MSLPYITYKTKIKDKLKLVIVVTTHNYQGNVLLAQTFQLLTSITLQIAVNISFNPENRGEECHTSHWYNFHIYVFSGLFILRIFRIVYFMVILNHANCSFSDVSDIMCQPAEHVVRLEYAIDKHTYNFYNHIQVN